MIVKTWILKNVLEAKKLLESEAFREANYDTSRLDNWEDRTFFVTEDDKGLIEVWSEDNHHLYWNSIGNIY